MPNGAPMGQEDPTRAVMFDTAAQAQAAAFAGVAKQYSEDVISKGLHTSCLVESSS